MRITQLACDWKEHFTGKQITAALKAVGGKDPQFYDFAQDSVDCKVMYISSHKLTDSQLEQLWNIGDLWVTDKDFIAGKSFDRLLDNLEAETLANSEE